MKKDLLTIAEAQIAEKQYQEIEKVKKRLDADKEVLKQAIELVNSHTLYKKVDSRGYGYKTQYVLATEEMLKEDYLKESKYHSGINFYFEDYGDRYSYNRGIMQVNDETYYDIRYVLQEYERSVQKKESDLTRLEDSLRKVKQELEEMNNEFPSLKKAITEWQEYCKQQEEENG